MKVDNIITSLFYQRSGDILPRHPFGQIKGSIKVIEIISKSLENNMLGDPVTRQVSIYLPPDYETSGIEYPLLVDLVGFTGSGFSHTNWKAFQESVPQRIERLVSEGKMGPVILALPDCFTSLGGNQYIDSIAMGNWAEYLTEEMIPTIEREYRVLKGREYRGVFGKSSGGYGAMAHGMLKADFWGAIAIHSGDVGFDRIYWGEFPKTVNVLNKHGGIQGFFDHIEQSTKLSHGEFTALMVLAMGASFDPDPNGPKGVRLPVDLHTCELIDERWDAWKSCDPIFMIENDECQRNLAKLSGIYIDCGSRDQYNIHFGTRQFVKRLSELNINYHYEEFDDTHSSIDYRMDVSLPFLYKKISL